MCYFFVCLFAYFKDPRGFHIFRPRHTALSYLFAHIYENLEIIAGALHYHIIDSSVTKLHHSLGSSSVNTLF